MRKFIITLIALLSLQTGTFAQISTDNVFALVIRRTKAGQDIADLQAKRDAYVDLLESQEGTLFDKEFEPFFEFTNSGLPVDSVFVGLTSFRDFPTFQEIGAATSGSIANDFFATFDFISFQVLQPLDASETVDLADFANLGTGQVWEVAMRDLSQYSEFDQTDYEQKRDDYLAVLAAQNNFVREVQWRSLSDSNIVVGMTVYKDAQSYSAVNADTAFINAYLATGFLQNYPINVYGAIHNPVKGTLDPGCQDIGQGVFPEDVTVEDSFLYVSHFLNGAITRKHLYTGETTTFVPPASDIYSSAWGLSVDTANQVLVAIANQAWDFNPANAKAGKVNTYDLVTGALIDSWDLPEATVGNGIAIDNRGNYYISDIGPDARILRINPSTDELSIWADDSLWVDGGFGAGNLAWNEQDAFYVTQGGALWYVPLNPDGTAGAALKVELTGTTAVDGSASVNADGLTWAGNNTLFYAENDLGVPGWNGIVHRVDLSDATTGTNTNFVERLNDPSGVYFAKLGGQATLFVNESQYGVAFGVNFVPTSAPFCVKTYEVNDIVSSISDLKKVNASIKVFPNPSQGEIQIESREGRRLQTAEVYTLDGRQVKAYTLNATSARVVVDKVPDGLYILKLSFADGSPSYAKVMIRR